MTITCMVEATDHCPGNTDSLSGVVMSDRTPTATILPMMVSPWTGRFEFDIYSYHGWNVATVEVVAHLDTIEIWFGQKRCVATLRRDLFRIWLHKPSATLTADNVAWTTDGRHSCIVIGDDCDGPIYAIHNHVVPDLRDLIPAHRRGI